MTYLESNKYLKELFVRRCGFELNGFALISKGICRNKILEVLDLSENTPIGSNCSGDEAIE